MADNFAVPPDVIRKLIFFTLAMIIAPLSAFFIVQQVFGGNAIVSGGIAAFVANIVLIGYVVVAYSEDIPAGDGAEKEETKKDR